MPASTRAVTRCRRLLQETPTQWQKDVPVLQFLPRIPRGSEHCALKASNAARSLSLFVWREGSATMVTGSKKRSVDIGWQYPFTNAASFDDVNTINDVLFDLCGAETTDEAEQVDPSAEHGDCIEDPLCSLQLTVTQSQSVDGTELVTQEEDVPFELLLEDQHKKRKLAAFERKKAARLQKGSNASESVDLVEPMLDSDNLVVSVKKKFKRIVSKKCLVAVVIPRKSPRLAGKVASPSLGELPGSGCEVAVVTPRHSPRVLTYVKPSPPIGSSLSAKAKRCGVKRKGGPAKVNKGCKKRSHVDTDGQDVVDEDSDDECVDQV
ncbi:hypothetical protein ZWY2020_035548 [Hordeum vulgare]|nr:hypothetical protein ZWY2020_035548 [Hordeum vulgare]